MTSMRNVQIEPFVDGLHEYLGRAFRPLVDRVTALERDNERLRALEARVARVEEKGIVYRGVFQRSNDYARGDLVTFKGSLWACTRATSETPGESASWQLTAKAGGA